MKKPSVTVRCRKVGKVVDPRTIRRRCERALGVLEQADAVVSVLLCDDDFIHELNKTYRGVNRPTDVLSFAMNEGETITGDSELLGDIIISVDTAIKQAPSLGHNTTEEITSLLVHGLLHLLGYDHQTESDELKMMKTTEHVLNSILSPRR